MKKSINQFGSDSPEKSPELDALRLKYLASPDHVRDLMHRCGWKQKHSPNVNAAACDLAQIEQNRKAILDEAASFFRSNAVIVPDGLDTIPTCWLATITQSLWSSRKPHWSKIPYFMSHCTLTDGVLAIAFAQEEPRDSKVLSAWDQVRVLLNINVKPNIWTRLSKEQERAIWMRRPDLRRELFNVPDAE